jgi:hypothetical protein
MMHAPYGMCNTVRLLLCTAPSAGRGVPEHRPDLLPPMRLEDMQGVRGNLPFDLAIIGSGSSIESVCDFIVRRLSPNASA